MQLVANGPEIPDELLDRHEEGEVVFFCGAGISYPAGLPGFEGLLQSVYNDIGDKPDETEKKAWDSGRYDVAFDLLERRLLGNRGALRRSIFRVLQPNLALHGATDTHRALLELARLRDGTTRLVTTNFDRLFTDIASDSAKKIRAYEAPLLPIPRAGRWNGLVYLHGLLPEAEQPEELNRIVVTSGDFGLAYLTDQWAARFVAELFRNYTVCFVGYSLNDPVMRYMLDAMAADRMLGADNKRAYAFAECKDGEQATKNIEWQAKGVLPILYTLRNGADHTTLHETLKSWSLLYKAGVTGKEQVVADACLGHPTSSTKQDDFAGRLIWAISDPTGLPARRFAQADPVPSLDWLTTFAETRLTSADLPRFGVGVVCQNDPDLRFSLVNRPSSHKRAPWDRLGQMPSSDPQWDSVMVWLARWLTRHLGDPALLVWFCTRGGPAHPQFRWFVQDRLDEVEKLEREKSTDELARQTTNAPNSVPPKVIRAVWRMWLAGQTKRSISSLDAYKWLEHVHSNGVTASASLELRQLLAPVIRIFGVFKPWSELRRPNKEYLSTHVDWEMNIATDHVASFVAHWKSSANWPDHFVSLFDDFDLLLADVLRLFKELEGGQEPFRSDLPSIEPHWQNKGLHEWTILIELVRDAWLQILERDAPWATRIVNGWRAKTHVFYARLVLFAASQQKWTAIEAGVETLLANDSRILWDLGTTREVLRFLVLRGADLDESHRAAVEQAILKGPAHESAPDEAQADERRSTSRMIWLRLAKLAESGVTLGAQASEKVLEMKTRYPEWALSPGQRDEFVVWISGTGDPDFEQSRIIVEVPRDKERMTAWLREPVPERWRVEDTWINTCQRYPARCVVALCKLASQLCWPVIRWRQALGAWSDDKFAPRTWLALREVVLAMPEDVLAEIAHSATTWAKYATRQSTLADGAALDLCQRVIRLELERWPSDGTMIRAVNSPYGHAAEIAMQLWFNQEPEDDQLLPLRLRELLSEMCDSSDELLRDARMILAMNAVALFRVDPTWFRTRLLAAFDWNLDPLEAKAVWVGYLWSARMHPPLLDELKNELLAAADHSQHLDDLEERYSSFLIHASLLPVPPFTLDELHIALSRLSPKGLNAAARTFARALNGSGEQRGQYWRSKILPLWQAAWPKSAAKATDDVAEAFALMAIAAGDEFPAALVTFRDWLKPLNHAGFVLRQLCDSKLPASSPDSTLELLDLIFTDQPWAPKQLRECLDEVERSAPALAKDARICRLRDYYRMHGIVG